MSIGQEWLEAAVGQVSSTQLVHHGQTEIIDPVERVDALFIAWARGFAAQRQDVATSAFRPASPGWHPDECAAFLRAVDGRQLHVDSAGYVWPLCATPKRNQQRYALCCKSGDGVTVNLEYMIQLAAVAELATVHGWPPEQLRVELGEFDAAVVDETDQPVILMEAKTRAISMRRSDDTLETLVRHWLDYRTSSVPSRGQNARNKYLHLLDVASRRPIIVLLVAAGARWWLQATRSQDHLDFEPAEPCYWPGT